MGINKIDTDFGLRPTDVKKIINTLVNYQEIEKVLVYGSRAKGNYKNNSDIDLTLIGEKLNQKSLVI
jgi:predicted nucleotidyltransferase